MMHAATTSQVTILPGGDQVAVAPGATLLDACRQAGVLIDAECDGKGVCGKCRLIVRQGRVRSHISIHLDDEDVDSHVVLACRSVPETDVTVLAPPPEVAADVRRLSQLAAEEEAPDATVPGLDPLVRRLPLTLAPTTVAEGFSDVYRVEAALAETLGDDPCSFELAALRKLGPAAREDEGRVTVTLAWAGQTWHITDVTAGHQLADRQIAVAVDIGTSNVHVHLVDLTTGRTIDAEAKPNQQAVHGRDYITRIMAVDRTTTIEHMQSLIVSDINELIVQMVERQGCRPTDVLAVVAAGNTPMIHFLLGLDPTMIRKEPYVAVTNAPSPVRAVDMGLQVADSAWLYPLPGVAAFVGSDITAGVLATKMHERDGLAILVDIGTNGEIVLGGREWLCCASSSAGTAFEGTRFGMRGVPGAIERVRANCSDKLELTVIGDAKPQGLCGSGVLDLIAELFRVGVLKRDGTLDAEHECASVRHGEDDLEYVVASGDETEDGRPIYLSQAEITNVIRSKAGVAAAITILLDLFEVRSEDLKAIYLAGAFGNFIDVGHAIRIGLLPEVPLEQVRYVGNTALMGAKRVLRSRADFDRIHKIAGAMTYIDLMTNPAYMDEFVQANFLPHTDPTRHPGVLAELGLAGAEP